MRAVSRYLLIGLILVFCISAVAQSSSNSAIPTGKTQAATPQIQKIPLTYTDPTSGRKMFDAYCASCHGRSGKGNGPAAPAMKVPPTNLTLLSAQHGGKFPETHVVLAIKGDSQASVHGNKEMPVWGQAFLSLAQMDEKSAQLRITNLTSYIESLQQK
jgi:mono/diheme cytochrome c family protein